MQTPIEITLDKDSIIAAQELEIERLRAELESRISEPSGWLTPLEIERMGEYSAYQIRRIVDRAIADPGSELINCYHYKRRRVGRQYRYQINWALVKDLIQ
jgi:hypothetical protein